MARKSRTPDPPRRVQAPQPRSGGDRGDGSGRRWLIPALLAGAGAIAAAALLALFAFGGDDTANDEVIRQAGCSLETYPAQERLHVEQPRKGFKYNSDPPTSGPHHGIPAPFDFYSEPVEQFRLVHNLEHGAVVIQYGLAVTSADVEALRSWYSDEPEGLVVAPLPTLGNEIALGAWVTESPQDAKGRGVLAKCPRFDEKAFDAFVDEYGFRGPERFERDDLLPGT